MMHMYTTVHVKTRTGHVIDKLSRGDIFVANFIPPVNGASLASYVCVKILTSV